MKKYILLALIIMSLPLAVHSETADQGCCPGCISPHGICDCKDKSFCSENCTCRSADQDRTNRDN